MATPAEHATAVETYFTRLDNTSFTDPIESAQRRVEVDAILATKAGTGDHYEDADSLLAAAGDSWLKIHRAKLHAILADSAEPAE